MNVLGTAQFISLLVCAVVIFAGLALTRKKGPTIKIADRIQIDQQRFAVDEALKELQKESIAEKENKLNWFERKQRELVQSNTGITFPVYIVLVILSMSIIFFVVYKITTLAIIAIPCSFLGIKIPDKIVKMRVRKNVERFNNDLIKALRRMASVMRSGGSLKQALVDVTRSRSMPLVIRLEFKKVLADIEYGDSIEEALYKLYERTGSNDVRFLAVAVEIQRQLGGNIAQTFDSIGQNITNRNLMQSEVKATLAQARTTSNVLSILPFVLSGIIVIINPSYFSPLFESLAGRMIVFMCLAFIVTGAFIMRKLSDIEL